MRTLRAYVMSLLALFLVASRALSVPVLDQEFFHDEADMWQHVGTSGVSADGYFEFAQTFTVGIAGALSRVELPAITRSSGFSPDLVLILRSTLSEAPASALMEVSIPSTSVPADGVYGSLGIDLPAPILVSVGEVFAMSFHISPGTMDRACMRFRVVQAARAIPNTRVAGCSGETASAPIG